MAGFKFALLCGVFVESGFNRMVGTGREESDNSCFLSMVFLLVDDALECWL